VADPFDRWEEFEQRLDDLRRDVYKQHQYKNIRQWLLRRAKGSIERAEMLRLQRNPDFKSAVADAEKCFCLLEMMRSILGDGRKAA
jgi:hypothetical protein